MGISIRRYRETALIIVVLALALAVGAFAEMPIAPSSLNRALDGAVRIHVTLSGGGLADPIDVFGSGWTRSCRPSHDGWKVIIATAGHVVDVDDLEATYSSGHRTTIKVVVAYRDGREFEAGRDDLYVDRGLDYGEVRLNTTRPRQVIPVGVPAEVHVGAPLHTVASPGSLQFAVFSGHLVLCDPIPVSGCPAQSWLASLAIGPGASGGPVLDQNGNAIATVVGLVEWRWGGYSAVIVPPPEASTMEAM